MMDTLVIQILNIFIGFKYVQFQPDSSWNLLKHDIVDIRMMG